MEIEAGGGSHVFESWMRKYRFINEGLISCKGNLCLAGNGGGGGSDIAGG